MKHPVLIHSEHDQHSRNLKEYLDSIGFKYCLLNWYTPQDGGKDPTRNRELVLRDVLMYLTGAMEGLAPPEPEVEFTDDDIKDFFWPDEFDRWIMSCCDHHKEFGYEGPPPRATGSLVFENAEGGYTLIDTPQQLEDIVNPDSNKIWSCKKGECLAGQWIDSAKATSLSPHYGNSIMREAVRRWVNKYETINLSEKPKELIQLCKKSEILTWTQL